MRSLKFEISLSFSNYLSRAKMPTTTTIPQTAPSKNEPEDAAPPQTAAAKPPKPSRSFLLAMGLGAGATSVGLGAGTSFAIAGKALANIVVPKIAITAEKPKNADFLFDIGF